MIRYAVIGTSAITEKFTAAAERTGAFSLSAVCSRDRERGLAFGRPRGCTTVYENVEALCRDDSIEAVYIASPNLFHEPQTRRCLESGKHVLCEKPIATTCAGYTALAELARQKGLVYAEAIMPLYAAGRSAVKEALSEVGDITLARIDFCQRSSRLDAFLAGQHVNIFDMSLAAGTLMDLGVYCVYAALDLLGEPEEVVSAVASLLPNGADGAGCALLRYPHFPAVLTYGKTGASAVGSEIVGERGTLRLASVSQYAGVTLVKGNETIPVVGTPDRIVLMSGEAQAFADRIRGRRASVDAAESERLCMAVHRTMDRIRALAGLSYPLPPR